MEFELGDKPITVGRSPDADVILLDERVSRIHCGIRLWDGDFFLKDLRSRNGTFVNGQAVEVTKLEPSDTIRVGSTVFVFEQESVDGAETALKEISDEMELGKGYSTILKEIVDNVPAGESAPAEAPAQDQAQAAAQSEASVTTPHSPSTTPTTEQRAVRVIIKKARPVHIKPRGPAADAG
jgi:predicted component of type VI protein secretion system